MLRGGDPVGEVEDHAGKEAGLREAKGQAQNVKRLAPRTKTMQVEMMPQVIMMRAIQSRGPTFSMMRLLGTSKRRYPMKKMLVPRP